jgi:hypothetical protein
MLKPSQQTVLMQILKEYVASNETVSEQFVILKTLIDKKFIHSEVYEIILLIREKMVQSYARNIQNHS